MTYLLNPRVRSLDTINTSSQLARGLVFWGMPDKQFGYLRNQALGKLPNATAHITSSAGTPSVHHRKEGTFVTLSMADALYGSTPHFGGKTKYSVLWAGIERTSQTPGAISDFLLGQIEGTFGSYDWGLYVAQASNAMAFFPINGSVIVDPTALTVGKFYVFVGTYDSGVFTGLYRNGTLVVSSTSITGSSGNNYLLRLGDDWNAAGVDQALYAFGLWDRPLTPTEVRQVSQDLLLPRTFNRPLNRLFNADVTGPSPITGTAALTFSNAIVSANGIMQPAGTAALTLANATLSANGVETIPGSAALTFANAVLDATGSSAAAGETTGTAALALRAVQLAASGSLSAAGTATLQLYKTVLAASGLMQPSGQATLVLPNTLLDASGSSAIAVSGTAALQLAAIQLAAAEIVAGITFDCSVVPCLISDLIRELVCDVVHPVVCEDEAGAGSLTGFSFTGAADWWAGTKAGTHNEVWAGNTSRDTLTMGYAPIMPATVGVRTWFGGPTAAFYDGCAYITWAAPSGTNTIFGVTKFTYATGAWEHATLKTVASVDDHNCMNIHVCSDGKLLVMFGRATIDNTLHWWKSTNAGDISAWSAEMTKAMASIGSINYPTICRLSSDSNRIYVLLRDAMYAGSGDGGIWYLSSSDEFATTGNVSAETKIIATAAGAVGGNSGLYWHANTNGTDRIDVCFSHFYDNSTTPQILHDVVHCYLTASAGTITVHASDGTNLGTGVVAYASFTAANKSLIYDTSVDAGSYRMWVADVQTYGGSPAVTACRYTDGDTNTEFDYIRWDFASGSWSSAKVVWNAPGDGVNGPVGTGAYSVYYGGCRMDASNANLMWLGVGNQTTTSRLKKLTSTDLFAANRTITEPYTQARRHNIRPEIPFNLAGEHVGKMDVFWIAGTYTSALSFDTMIVHPYWSGAKHAFDMNEPSGTPANKLRNWGGVPALVGGPTLNQTGINNGKAISFDGINDALDTAYSIPLAEASLGALLHWQKTDSISVTGIHGSTNGRKFWGILNTNEWILGVGASSLGSSLGATGITAGAWHHWGVLVSTSGGNPHLNIHLDGVSKFSHSDAYTETGETAWLGAMDDQLGGTNWFAGDTCQFIADIAAGRNTAFIAAVAGYATAGTFTSARKIASVTGGPITGITVTPTATLPSGASYDLTLYSTTSPGGQTKTGTASTPISFDGITIADGDEVWIEIEAASSDKTVAPSFTEFAIAA